jgi:ParB/RepB/Spo0J family partition protein
MAMEKIDLVELGLDGGDGGTGARRYVSKPMSRSFGEVTVSEIVVPADRMRQEVDGKAEGERLVYLRMSMAALGLIHPISITKDKLLVVGERRLICAKELGWPTIPVQWVADASPGTRARIEYEENYARKNLVTLEEMRGKARYAKEVMAAGLTQKQVAERMRKSEQYLSNTLKNVEFADTHPEAVKYCETEDHIKRVREKHERVEGQRQLENMMDVLRGPPKYEIITKDFIEWVNGYRGLPFDLLHIDFPHGIGQDRFGQKSRTDETYEDSPEVFDRLCNALEANMGRIVAENAHGTFWFPMTRYQAVFDGLVRMGWQVNPRPFVWAKPTAGIIPIPGKTFRQCYETAFICTRGDRQLIQTIRDWFEGDPPRGPERDHQSEKNEEMLTHLLGAFIGQTTRLLDPTCGSGVAIRVAKRLKAEYALGLEISEHSALLARAKLGEMKE